MTILTFVLPLENHIETFQTRDEILVREVAWDSDLAAVKNVVESCHLHDGLRVRPDGGLAELVGRAGRSVTPWLALVDDAPCGVVGLVATGEGLRRRHSISWLLVSDHARRRGVGRALVGAAVRAARADAARRLWVQTRADWAAAVAFWRSVGFREPP